MAYREYRDPRTRLHRVTGPAIESEDGAQWWVDGKRHRDDGPAIESKLGTKIFYWRGTMVPKEVILNPKCKLPAEILKIENIEVRRSWMEAYGMEEFMKTMNPTIIHEDKKTERTLMKLEVPNDEALVLVKVRNSTAEGKWAGGQPCNRCGQTGYIRHEESTPEEEIQRTCPDCEGKGRTKMVFTPELKDGKPYFKHYFLRVPPDQTNANDAVAWTFGVEKGGYKPEVES